MSILCCVYMVGVVWFKGKCCIEELWEEVKVVKVKCVSGRGGYLIILSVGEGCVFEDYYGVRVEGGYVEDGLDGVVWR